MQMFSRLLERKLWAQRNEDVTDLAFFDEHIRLKHIRNGQTFKRKGVSESAFLSDKTQGLDFNYDCDALLRVTKNIDEPLFLRVYQGAEVLAFDFPDPEMTNFIHKVVPHQLNIGYMHQLFLNDLVPRDPLRRFKDTTFKKMAVARGDVRDRKVRVQ
jgi:hypothetical protein